MGKKFLSSTMALIFVSYHTLLGLPHTVRLLTLLTAYYRINIKWRSQSDSKLLSVIFMNGIWCRITSSQFFLSEKPQDLAL